MVVATEVGADLRRRFDHTGKNECCKRKGSLLGSAGPATLVGLRQRVEFDGPDS